MGSAVDRFYAIVSKYEGAHPHTVVMEVDGLCLCVDQLREVATKMAENDRTARMLTDAIAYGDAGPPDPDSVG